MFLVYAEHDSLRKAIRLFQEICEVSCDGVRAGPQCHHALEVLRLIFIVRNRPSEPVQLISTGTPSGSVPGGYYPVDAVRRKKAVVDALPQAVFIDRITQLQV